MDDHWTSRLSEYLDEELDRAERSACDAHLVSCAACRSTLQALRQVVARAQALTDERPPADLWPGIEAGLERRTVARLRKVLRFRLPFTLPQAAAAGILLAVVSAAVVWLVQPRPQIARPEPAQAGSEAVTAVVGANFADESYDRAIADLERTLAERRAELDPKTVASIERSLQTIDRAIAEARQALDADPGNVYLNGYFASTRRRKLDLLRQASALAHTES